MKENICSYFDKILSKTQSGEIKNFEQLFQSIKDEKKKNKKTDEWILNYPLFMCDALFDIKDSKNILPVISELKKKKKVFEKNGKMNQYYYAKGNLLFNKAQLIHNSKDDEYKFLTSDKFYFNSIKEFLNIAEDFECTFYIRSLININCILHIYGRVYETIYRDSIFDNNLKNFGPLHGNKAISLLEYWNKTPSLKRHEEILHDALRSLRIAKKDSKRTSDFLGINNYQRICFEEEKLSKFIKDNNVYNSFSLNDNNSYYQFCLENSLFINFHLSYEARTPDDLKDFDLISFVSDKFEEHSFNKNLLAQSEEIIEDYITSRYLYYKYCTSIEEIREISKFSNKKDILFHGILKTVFIKLYNILDKISQLIIKYLEIGSSDNIYFKNLIEESFKAEISNYKSRDLLGLYSLALSFEEGNIYYNLRAIRNKLVHEYFSINSEEFNLVEKEINIDNFNSNTELLFQCVKGAMFNVFLGINKIEKGEIHE